MKTSKTYPTVRFRGLLAFAALTGCIVSAQLAAQGQTSGASAQATRTVIERVDSQVASFRVVNIGPALQNPWGMAFLPDGRILVTERPGRLRVWDGTAMHTVANIPQIAAVGQGGLLDIAIDPAFASNKTVYFSYAAAQNGQYGTRVARAVLNQSGTQYTLADVKVIFDMLPKTGTGVHFSGRLAFLPDGTLILTLGDRGSMDRAQNPSDPAGKMIRIKTDGTVPPDNPGTFGKPEYYSTGHRNPQGIAIHPQTGQIWETEHGPQGGDEVNVVLPGRNYGWPVITYGRQYVSGTQIGEGTAKPGMEQPLTYWIPSIAPSGLAWYTGTKFPSWTGNLFAGALAGQVLVRITVDANPAAPKVISQERLLTNRLGRIRDVENGPDGYLYLLLDEGTQGILRLEPL